MANVRWSDHALERMRENAQFIAEQSSSREIAWRWANDVFEAANGLVDFPDIGRTLPEFPDVPYREILVRRSYRLIYRKIGETCNIITLRRSSMLLDEATLAELNSVV